MTWICCQRMIGTCIHVPHNPDTCLQQSIPWVTGQLIFGIFSDLPWDTNKLPPHAVLSNVIPPGAATFSPMKTKRRQENLFLFFKQTQTRQENVDPVLSVLHADCPTPPYLEELLPSRRNTLRMSMASPTASSAGVERTMICTTGTDAMTNRQKKHECHGRRDKTAVLPTDLKLVFKCIAAFFRLHHKGYRLIRYPLRIARYRMIKHSKAYPNPDR